MGKIKFSDAQLEIIRHRQGNMIVSASAGSGKTAVMVERVLQIIEEGTPIDRVVLLAFNNAVAAELRGKMYKKMVERIAEDDCLPERKEFLKEQIDRLPFCNIVTNDSYCNSTASEFFQILGVDPNADIIVGLERDMMFAKSFYSALGKLKEEPNGEIFELSLKFGGDSELLKQIDKINSYVSCQVGGMQWLDNAVGKMYTNDITQSNIMPMLFDIAEKRLDYALSIICDLQILLSKYPKLQEGYLTCKDMLNTLKQTKDYKAFYDAVKICDAGKKPAANAKNMKDYDIDWYRLDVLHKELNAQIDVVKKYFVLPLDKVQDVHKKTKKDIELLVRLYKLTHKNFELEKAESGKFEFTDFSQNLIKLLNNPDIRREIVQRYDYICVDEYQDTNYVQDEIYTKISNDNNLFMVGDRKQSIYRFRLSEPKILLEKYEDFNNDPSLGTTKMLEKNYRSDRGIVNFANDVFNVIMTKEFGGIDYKETDQLQYGADYKIPPDEKSFEIHLFEPDEEKKEKVHKTFDEVYSVRDDIVPESEPSIAYREGQFIAEKIKEIVNTYAIYDPSYKPECDPDYDPSLNGRRRVKYSDIALLAKSGKGKVREIVKAIQDEGIPIELSQLLKEEGVYEVEIVKDILRLVANDMQDYALAAVLVSYWVGMDYDDLLTIREKHPKAEYFWQAVQAEKNNDKVLEKLYTMIDNLRIKASFSSIKEVADSIVFDYGFDQHVLSEDGGSYKLSVLKTYLATLDDLSSDCSLSEYVATLGSGEMEIKGGVDGNIVKAMTIHKSKGLEFPIVFICNMEKSLTISMPPKLRIDKDFGIAINYFDKDTKTTQKNLAFDVLAKNTEIEEKLEAMRVFYVALTRPKNHLIMTGAVGRNGLVVKNQFDVNSFLDWIAIAKEENVEIANAIYYHDFDEFNEASEMERYSFQISDIEAIPEIDEYLNFSYPHKSAQSVSTKYTVTEINKQNGESSFCLKEDELFAEDSDIATIDRAKRGTNYHAVLEHIDINTTTREQVEKQLLQMVAKGVLTDTDLKEINIAEIVAIMNSGVMQYARENKFYREKEFTMSLSAKDVLGGDIEDAVIVQGTIDLLIVGEQVWVVDYKKSNESTEVLKERYKTQLEIYSKAVERGIGRKVDKAMLLIIGRCEIIEINI